MPPEYSILDEVAQVAKQAKDQWISSMSHAADQLETHDFRLRQSHLTAGIPSIEATDFGHLMKVKVAPGVKWTQVNELIEGIDMPVHIVGDLE